MKGQLIQRLIRAGLSNDIKRADMWLRHRVDHNTRRRVLKELFPKEVV